jgi:molecular chaperone GrpE
MQPADKKNKNGEDKPVEAAENVTPLHEKPAGEPVKDLAAELAAAKDQLLRTMADSENARKRMEREKEDAQKYATSSFARDVLTVADNLRRALDAVKKEDIDKDPALGTLLTGVEFTEKELLKAMEKHGVKRIEPAIGDTFDYNRHQAMFEIETTEKPPGTIMQVLQGGFVIHDRLLRPALVGVAKAPPAPEKVDVKA